MGWTFRNHTHCRKNSIRTSSLTYLLHGVENSSESNQFSASQEISHILWNRKVHYLVYKNLHLSLSRATSIHSIPSNPTFWRSILYQRISLGQRHIYTLHNKASCYGENLQSPRPIHPAWGSPLVCCPRVLIQYVRSCPRYWRSFLHPQPENALCRGDRDPLVVERGILYTLKCFSSVLV